MNRKQLAHGVCALEEDSDEEHADSSDDDLDIVLHGSLEQRKRLFKRRAGGAGGESSEDDFEKEMKAELNNTMNKLQASHTSNTRALNKSDTNRSAAESVPYYCGNDCIDSYSDDRQTTAEKKANDELLYDPNLDEVDQKWVDSLRGQYQPVADSLTLPASDAILNCPCCMVTLCLDCQRHAVYQHQYRAMFVMNCYARTDEVLRLPATTGPRGRKRKTKHYKPDDLGTSSRATASSSETVSSPLDEGIFHPVMCSECNTEVGVYDCEEIYHFFNVLASHA